MYHGHVFVILPLFIQLIIFHDELLPFSEGCKSEWTGKIIVVFSFQIYRKYREINDIKKFISVNPQNKHLANNSSNIT